jgi:hypothetical protein
MEQTQENHRQKQQVKNSLATNEAHTFYSFYDYNYPTESVEENAETSILRHCTFFALEHLLSKFSHAISFLSHGDCYSLENGKTTLH